MQRDEEISLLTFVLAPHHCRILEDWLDFIGPTVRAIVAHIGPDPAVRAELQKVALTHGVALEVIGETDAQTTTKHEVDLVAEQIARTRTALACIVRLDTIPYRLPGVDWLQQAADLSAQASAPYVTGSTLPFRGDRPTPNPRFILTQRISNCFLLIAPEFWKQAQSVTEELVGRHGRFVVEGAIEDYLAARNLWGLRLLNSDEIRVMHCHEWSPRLLEVRDAFRRGYRIRSYTRGYQDEPRNRRRFYLKPGPPLHRRIRIFVGKWRRKLFG